MADITMCADLTCPLAPGCYRFTATPSPYRQAYFVESPRKHPEDPTNEECGYYWPTKAQRKAKGLPPKERK